MSIITLLSVAINSPYLASFNECACFDNLHRRASTWVFPLFAGQQKQGIADIPRPSTPNFYNRVSCDLTSWVWFKWKRTKTGSERVDSWPEGKNIVMGLRDLAWRPHTTLPGSPPSSTFVVSQFSVPFSRWEFHCACVSGVVRGTALFSEEASEHVFPWLRFS